MMQMKLRSMMMEQQRYGIGGLYQDAASQVNIVKPLDTTTSFGLAQKQ